MNKNEIEVWLDFHDVENYTINEDLGVDVSGVVDLSGKSLIVIPIRFRNVGGNFSCTKNSLVDLSGCPIEVGGDFNCSFNKLTTNKSTTYNFRTTN